MAEKKKMGRPTDNPKSKPIHVRLDQECESILASYCAKNDVTQTEAIRRAIKNLKSK